MENSGSGAILVADSPRPVDSIAKTLATRFGIQISSEDPWYACSDEVKKIPEVRGSVPRGGRLEVQLTSDVLALLQSVVEAANARLPFAYRLDVDGKAYAFVPTRNCDGSTPALLDAKVTIPSGTRTMIEHAALLSEALSVQYGAHVGCCQAGVGGIPWGLETVKFEARDEVARSVLRRLTGMAGGRYAYLQRCDPIEQGRKGWCFINVIPVGVDAR